MHLLLTGSCIARYDIFQLSKLQRTSKCHFILLFNFTRQPRTKGVAYKTPSLTDKLVDSMQTIAKSKYTTYNSQILSNLIHDLGKFFFSLE